MQIPADKESSSFVGGSNLVVFKNTKNRDSSWKLVNWLSDPKTQVKWYGMSTDLPSVKSAWQDPALTSDTKLAVFGKQLETAQAPPSFPTWEQVVTSFDTEMEKVTKTGADPGAALKTVQKQAESIGTGS
jgi:multiple sugar transport system substrate-binding protein